MVSEKIETLRVSTRRKLNSLHRLFFLGGEGGSCKLKTQRRRQSLGCIIAASVVIFVCLFFCFRTEIKGWTRNTYCYVRSVEEADPLVEDTHADWNTVRRWHLTEVINWNKNRLWRVTFTVRPTPGTDPSQSVHWICLAATRKKVELTFVM